MTKQWYVLHVLTGSELEAHRQLKAQDIDSLVVQETCMIRRGGRWHEETRILFPGYVFVYMKYTVDMHYVIKGVTGAIRLLPKDSPPQPLPVKEAVWLLDICGQVLTPSMVDFNGDKPVVVDGPLKLLEEHITKFDRHRRRAQLRIPVLGEGKDITLSILPV